MGRKPKAKKRDLDPDLREKWIEELEPLFHKKGIHKVSSAEIAAHLGISKATLYQHFKSRDEIFRLSQEKHLVSMNIENILQDHTVSYQKRFLRAFGSVLLHLQNASNILLEDCKMHYPPLWKNILEFNRNLESHLKVFFAEGIKKGEFKDIHPMILTRTLLKTIEEIINPEFLIKNNLTLKQAFFEVFMFMAYGILKDQKGVNQSKEEAQRLIDQIMKEAFE
jgi:AcrR family transcriptional regulator